LGGRLVTLRRESDDRAHETAWQHYLEVVVNSAWIGHSGHQIREEQAKANPNRIPSGRDWTFFAKYPVQAPTISPLNVEPITMPNIWSAPPA